MSFYVRYAREVARQRNAIKVGALPEVEYRDIVSGTRLANAAALPDEAGTIGGHFDILYGQKELHSRDGIPPGDTLVISPTEEYNGCYGWLDFPQVLTAPFATVAQTGSIGEAFVQFESCAVNDDCLVLLPKDGETHVRARLLIAAATIRLERWRFNYGRKLTSSRIASFAYPDFEGLEEYVEDRIKDWMKVAESAVKKYADVQPTEDPTDAVTSLSEEVGYHRSVGHPTGRTRFDLSHTESHILTLSRSLTVRHRP